MFKFLIICHFLQLIHHFQVLQVVLVDPPLSEYLQEVLFLQVYLVVQAIQIVHEFQVDQVFQLYLVDLVVLKVQEDLPSPFLLSNPLDPGDLSNQELLEHLVFPKKEDLMLFPIDLKFRINITISPGMPTRPSFPGFPGGPMRPGGPLSPVLPVFPAGPGFPIGPGGPAGQAVLQG